MGVGKYIIAGICLHECSKRHDCKECVSKAEREYNGITPCEAFGNIFGESMWDYREKVQK